MGLSSKKTKTTPIVSSWMEPKLTGYAGKVDDFLSKDPTQFVAPASPLQEQAFSAAQNLGGWKPYAQQAAGLADAFASKPATSVSAIGYRAPQVGTPSPVSAARLGAAPTFDAASVGPVMNADPYLTDFHSILDDGGIQKYLDPAVQSYVNTTLADYDENTSRQRAAMQAQAAGNGAFGGSRYGLQLGQFDADTARGRASTEGDLRRAAYEQALQSALAEAGRHSQIDLSNNALRTQVSGQNAAAANTRAQIQAQLEQEARAANANLLGQYGMQQAGFEQQANSQDAENRLRAALAQLGVDADALQFGASAQNSANFTNAQLQEQSYLRTLQAAGLLGDLSSNYGSNDRADLGLTSDLGATQRGVTSEYLNAYPTQLQMAGNLYHAIPPEAYIGAKNKSSGGALGQILGSAAQAAASALAFSDRRLKTETEKVGSHGALGLYRFRFLGDGKERVGVMADEVAVHAPYALGPVIGGYATVDYGKLGLAHLMEM